ncbi:MAG TPA: cyanophycinase [Tetrasphaera sp.]|uniref:cyanophycinase n=1 Tax=Nostocoides sp. TaxID=1917966 RepID=UPI002CB932DA|nr:cyanophycinase [Tetrasphaera sp.]HNQ06692.1 cyanophycinase [Tetrasphaera sp.]
MVSPAVPLRKLLIIGGAEDRVGKAKILRRFVKLAGGKEARIVIIPTASSFQDEVVAAYRQVFARFGATGCAIVNPRTRSEADDASLVQALDEATGVFMSGGNQLKLSQIFAGTACGEAILRAHRRGAVVGGTSAGASIMSEFMISLGDESVTPRQRTSQLTHGLGLLDGVIVDQHFAQRQRYGRLMSIVASSPNLIGIGIDEDTAIEVTDNRELTVIGRGAAYVLDCRRAITDAPEARTGAPLLVSGAIVHSLPAGATFDITKLMLTDFVEQHPDLGVTVTAAASSRP